MEIIFRFGALSDKLELQANEQGFTMGAYEETAEHLKSSILTLKFHNILTDTEIDRSFKKLHKQILKHLKPIKE